MLTVAAAQALIDSGAADGRFIAVGGYWYSYFLPCAFQPHMAPLADHCGYGVLTDDQRNPDTGQAGFSPAMVTESAASFNAAQNGSRLVAIVHVADDRLWQCAADSRAACKSRPVMDRMAWVDGQAIDPTQFQPQPQVTTEMSVEAAGAAASNAAGGGPVVLAYPLAATSLNDVDPRFIGKGTGTVWYARVISGAADADGTAEGTDVLVNDSTGAVASTMPLAVDLDQQPARVVFDVKPPDGSNAQFFYSITVSIPTQVAGPLGSTSTPLVLVPGVYSVHATANPPIPGTTPCDLPLRVDAGADVAYYADYSVTGDCTWIKGSLFP